MIVVRLLRRLIPRTDLQYSIKAHLSSTNTPMQIQKELKHTLQKLNLSAQKSIYLEDESRELTAEQKRQLGLFLPKPNFPVRMGHKQQQQYRPQICEGLYQSQQQLQKRIKILQMCGSKRPTVDQYINSIYKDIFARYLISRGLGIDWEVNYSAFGILNPETSPGHDLSGLKPDFVAWMNRLLGGYKIEKLEVMGLYSYGHKVFVPLEKVKIETISKVGQFAAFPLTQFGNYADSFTTLHKKGSKIDLLVFVENPIKLVDPQGLSIENNAQMIILEKNEEVDGAFSKYYLITSMEVYSQNRSYFTNKGYSKHSLVNSKHLIGMASKSLKIYPEIQGYQRKQGIYLIDKHSSLADFERASEHELQSGSEGPVDVDGVIKLKGERCEDLSIHDWRYKQKLQEKIKDIDWINLYETYEDQIYSYEGQILHFRVGHKYSLAIPNTHYQQLNLMLESVNLSESKVVVPSLNRHYHKPRDKRRHRKQINQLKKQQTEHMSLMECIEEIEYLGVSNIYQQDGIRFPLLLNEREEPLRYTHQMCELVQSWVKPDGTWQFSKIEADLQSNKIILKWIQLSPNLVESYKALRKSDHSLSNVIIEPQSQTQQRLPYLIHLFWMLTKLHRVGRRSKPTLNKIFTLIKLHPTISDEQKTQPIDRVLFGVTKANQKQQYGYGLEALRLWVSRRDDYLGDRTILVSEIDKQMKLASFIRKLYWEITPLIRLDNGKSDFEYEELPYLHRFMLDHINYYVANMEQAYSSLNLSKAIALTEDFFKSYAYEIFVKNVRKRMIAYPKDTRNQHHILVLKRLIEILGVVAPIMPFSAYHISKAQLMPWPSLSSNGLRVQLIPAYNRMTKLRTEIRNKLILNNFSHAQLVMSADGECWNISEGDLQLFFDLDSIRSQESQTEARSFKLKLSQNHPIGNQQRIRIYEYEQICIRCSPQKASGSHICAKCLAYMNTNYDNLLSA